MWETKIKPILSKRSVQLGLVSTTSLGSGLVVGYAVATRRAELRFNQLLEEEVAQFKEDYSRRHKVGEFADPVKVATESTRSFTERPFVIGCTASVPSDRLKIIGSACVFSSRA